MRSVDRVSILLAIVLTMIIVDGITPSFAAHTTGTLHLYSPLGGNKDVTSPPRYHSGGSCTKFLYWDSPQFDDPSSCESAAPSPDGDWSIDIADGENGRVYIDMCPVAVDGSSALSSPWRVVAGNIGTWSGSGNNQYQIFVIQVQRPDLVWENYGWVLLGHIDSFQYPTYNQTVISARTTCGIAWVGDIAAPGSYPTHVHMEGYNESNFSRTYEWDGPFNADQPDSAAWGPACSRTISPAFPTCEPRISGDEAVGYIGGNKSSFLELNNPYYAGF